MSESEVRERYAREIMRFLRQETCAHTLEEGGEGHCIDCEPGGVVPILARYRNEVLEMSAVEADAVTFAATAAERIRALKATR